MGQMAKINELKLIRLILEMNQGDMAAALGYKSQSYYSELEGDPGRPAARQALEKAKATYKEREKEDWESVFPGVRESAPVYVTGALPEHVQEAYKIVRDALDTAKADISTMDQDQIGLVIGLAAEEIAKGNQAEARQTLLRRAEVLLGLKAP